MKLKFITLIVAAAVSLASCSAQAPAAETPENVTQYLFAYAHTLCLHLRKEAVCDSARSFRYYGRLKLFFHRWVI